MPGRRIAITGGIACGKSLVAKYLEEFGVETLDADDVVHELIPDPAERRRLAAEVFADPAKRRELEAKIHPLVKEKLTSFISDSSFLIPHSPNVGLRIVIVPLLFEVHWEPEFDIICCVVSSREKQIERMTATRGYTLAEAEARLNAQLPVEEKAAKSHYVIHNDGTAAELKSQVEKFVEYVRGI